MIFAWRYKRAVARACKYAKLYGRKYYVLYMGGKLKVVPKKNICELIHRARLAADHLPRQQIAVVLHDRHEHLIARLDVRQAVAVGDEVQALGRVAGKDDLTRRACPDEIAHGLARPLIDIGRLHAQRIQPAQRVGIMPAVEIRHRVQHALRALRRGRVIDIGDVRVLEDRKIPLIIMRHR